MIDEFFLITDRGKSTPNRGEEQLKRRGTESVIAAAAARSTDVSGSRLGRLVSHALFLVNAVARKSWFRVKSAHAIPGNEILKMRRMSVEKPSLAYDTFCDKPRYS